ncbi:MAG: alanine racemase [Gemmatimonadaceae bacterium]
MTRAWVDVDLGALRRNGAAIAARAGVPLLPMVKADAYGLGAVRVAHALEELDPWGFGVATLREGEELRRAGISRPIVVFTPLLPTDLDAARRAHLRPALESRESIQRWAVTGEPWHLSIDTGMSRAGVRWTNVADLRDVLELSPPEGAFTHFHSADVDDGSREEQERRFADALATLPMRPMLLHAENGAAAARVDRSRWDLTRPGIFLYGVGSGPGARATPEPVVAVRARVTAVRWIEDGETVSYLATYRAVGRRRIATVPLGYADGYRRSLSNRATAIVNGQRAPIAGLVTMDMTMIDVTEVACEIGDVVTLLGRDGDDVIDMSELGEASGLSPYELLTGLRQRLPRRYLETGD